MTGHADKGKHVATGRSRTIVRERTTGNKPCGRAVNRRLINLGEEKNGARTCGQRALFKFHARDNDVADKPGDEPRLEMLLYMQIDEDEIFVG